MITPKRLRHLATTALLAAGTAACAPQSAGPATAPPAASLSSGAGGQGGASPAGMQGMGGMQGMDHSNMPGMGQAGMQGMDHQGMMAHCAQMRQQTRAGAAMSADMRQMMAHCDEMDRGMGMSGQGSPTMRRGL